MDYGNILLGRSYFQTLNTKNSQTTHEVRISSDNKDSPIEYTLGYFYSKTPSKTGGTQPASFLAGAFGSPGAPANPRLLDARYMLPTLINVDNHATENSVFANVRVHLGEKTELIRRRSPHRLQGRQRPDGVPGRGHDRAQHRLPVLGGRLRQHLWRRLLRHPDRGRHDAGPEQLAEEHREADGLQPVDLAPLFRPGPVVRHLRHLVASRGQQLRPGQRRERPGPGQPDLPAGRGVRSRSRRA
ncbi:hypothetical protein ACRAWD_27580 [Caulobacter segnis]